MVGKTYTMAYGVHAVKQSKVIDLIIKAGSPSVYGALIKMTWLCC